MKNALAAAIASALALLLAECALRVFGLFTPPAWPPILVGGGGLFAPDPATGHRLYPASRSCLRYPQEGGALFEMVSNADGFRSARELDAPDPRRRIAVLGDSFAFGLGVEERERFTERLESQLVGWRVDNLGMPSWGAGEMVRALEELGPRLDPDVVVLAMYTHDFLRLGRQYAGMGYPSPKFALEGGALREVPFLPAVGWRRMRLYQLGLRLQARRDPSHLALNEALFERFRERSLALGARPVALFLPGRGRTPADASRRDLLRDWAARRSVPFADLTAAFDRAGRERTTLPNNAHWNAAGHRVAAGALRDLLVAARIVDASELAREPADPAARRSYCHDARIEGPELPAAPAQDAALP